MSDKEKLEGEEKKEAEKEVTKEEVKEDENKTKETIIYQAIEDDMKQSYIDYAMSVIVSRALPDVRDGMKPVQRRILYAMHDIKLTHNARYRKSAAVVWEVIGKYHPHGDSSIYEAMVRLAQPFSLRYPLVDGQGNFGSIDGDGAAAMRYTEARLTKIAEEMLIDLEKNTIVRNDNYDSSKKEPSTLSTKFPALLCNGTMGIAVGMATNMPPNNLTEIINALLLLIDNEEATMKDIMGIVKGPDFPTGGVIFDHERISEIYSKGRGSIIMRGKIHHETDNGKNVIIIDELPYQVNKANLVGKIWQLVGEKKLTGIKELTDESDKGKMRVSIVLKPGVDKNDMLIKLYKLTDLQTTFPVNNVVLTERGLQPKLLNIKDMLEEFIVFRREVVNNRSLYLLAKDKARLHILEWLQKAIDIIDEVIATIRGSKTREDAKKNLMKNFEFSLEQAEYILMLRLQTLVGLEIEKVINEIDDKKINIDYLTGIVENQEKLDAVVKDELIYMKDKYWDKRRTDLSEDLSVYNLDKALRDLKKQEDFIKEDVLLRMSVHGDTRAIYQTRIAQLPRDTYQLYKTNNQEKVFIVTEKGWFINPRIKDLPATTIKGPVISWKKFGVSDKVIFADPTDRIKDYMLLLTNKNSIKKVSKEILMKIKKNVNIMKLQPGEKIISVISVDEGDLVGIMSKKGIGLIFPEDNVRSMGRLSGGITAMGLADGDKVATMFNYYPDDYYIVMFGDDGFGKSIMSEELKETKRWFIQKRGRKWFSYTRTKQGQNIQWALSIDEGDVRLLDINGEVKAFDVDKLPLMDRDTYMKRVVGGRIAKVFKLWE